MILLWKATISIIIPFYFYDNHSCHFYCDNVFSVFLAEIHMAGTQYVDVGDTITLQCNATGVDYIPEDVDWFKDGNEIRPNPLTKIYITKYQSVSARSLHSELEIKHGQMSDAGTYICRISEMDIASLKVHVLNGKYQLFIYNYISM